MVAVMEADEYLNGVEQALIADGSQVSQDMVAGLPVLVGYRSDFNWRWVATRLHLFTVVAVAPPDFDDRHFQAFTRESVAYAVAHKGRFRGAQTGVAAIPIVVGSNLSPAVQHYANQTIDIQFAAFGWPAAMELTTGEVSRHPGHALVGRVYRPWMRERTLAVLPPPS
jgi:hypothetical protein